MSTTLFDLSGKLALLTGSSRGIGKHLARGMAEAGATVIINGMNPATVASTVAEFESAGLKAIGKPFDVTDSDSINTAVAEIEANTGPIDILVNNAGIQRRTPLLECDDATWEEVMNTNLASVFRVSRAVAKNMVERKQGKIINTCSIQSELGRPTIAPYAASKGGVKMLTKNMCAEWAPHNVQVNGLGPGYFATELTAALVDDAEFSGWLCKRTPAGRWGDVKELIGAAIFLAAPASNFVNGHILYVDGGMSAVV
ncbi:SDR family NAD(P)-dependent oxidoreductase [Granulosicoccus antarcticus]|uniref:Gluconate 5-dehydrogenase n=1 Tax=Granulosicoccus antarcticus IMCC3135 TaxID=1192854 RepID=A0A2Z2NG98_9GAMM|nr:SDR family NAD(P)-dependent oxidoreductase [Granulosicoccus antarcticus]ASJ70282.1 Gluconate 5-dehydrogenase [Granulosicoccus antarcticus IMCC3135]